MNILLINHYAGSPRMGMEYRPAAFAKEWARLGHTVTVVAASYSHLRNVQPRMHAAWTRSDEDGQSVVWLLTPAYSGNGFARVRNIFTFLFQLLRYRSRIVRETQPDVIIASSTYPLDVPVARWFARRCRASVVHEIHDLWPLTLIELGGFKHWHPFIRLLQWAENYSCRHSDLVVSMLPCAGPYLEIHGLSPARFAVVPNGVDTEIWDNPAGLPQEHELIFDTLKQEGRIIVGYTGGHGVSNALDVLIDAAAQIQNARIRIVLVGQGPEKETLKARAASLGVGNVSFLPPVPKAAMPSLLARCDILFHAMRRSPLYAHGISPNKLLDYMMSARPVVQAIDACNNLVADSGCGSTVAPDDPRALAQALEHMAGLSPTERDSIGSRGRTHVLANYTIPVLAAQFAQLLEQHITHHNT